MEIEDSENRGDSRRAEPPSDPDTVPALVLERLSRIIEYVDRGLDSKLAEFGISQADWAVLAALYRSGSPFRVSQRDLSRQLSRTSGGMSLRIDSLVRDELVIREQDVEDRRSTFVVLTEKGSQLTVKVQPVYLANQARMLAGLTDSEAQQLATLAGTWLLALESGAADIGIGPLGLTILSPQTSLSKRRSVGLPDCPGLLVQSVEADGRAATAGLRRGDLIINVDSTLIDSTAAFVRAARKSRPIIKKIDVLRGAEELTFHVDCSE